MTALLLRHCFTLPPVTFVVTVPGPGGEMAAFAGELAIAMVLMGTVLYFSNRARLMRLTGLMAGILIASFVTFESPLSGFGMNPARTFASALPSGIWTALWLYFVAPTLGMLLAAEGYCLINGSAAVRCCKLHHDAEEICIFCGRRTTLAPGERKSFGR